MRKVLASLGVVLTLAVGASAQFLGYTSAQTVTSVPFNATACTGLQQTFVVPNIGQQSHVVIFQSSSVTFIQLSLQGSNDGVTFFDISELATGSSVLQNGSVVGSGYYNVVRVSVKCNGNGSPTITAFYSGQSLTPGQLFGAALTSQLVKNFGFGLAANTNFSFFSGAGIRTPFASSGGSLYFTYAATGPAGSTFSISCGAEGSTTTFVPTATWALGTGTATQAFQMPATSCPFLTANYTSGGASATTFTAYLVFNQPGSAPLAYQNTHVTGTTATSIKGVPGFLHTVTVNTGGVGTVSLFDLATASCTGTPATNVVAVITATATTLQTLTYDVNFVNGICLKASAAMDLTASAQ